MSRPRIRTVKPEMWRDEKVGQLSHGARLLLVGMITSADDEGRLRAVPSALAGDIFMYDKGTDRKVPVWMGEVAATGMVVFYEHAGVPYAAFRHWRRHQRINRARASVLPPPPDHSIVTENAVIEE